MALFTLMVATKPKPGREGEWNRWYDEVHLDEVLSLSGFHRAYRLSGIGQVTPDRANVAVYEIEAEDDAGAVLVLDHLKVAALTTTDALDPDSVTFDLYRNCASRVGSDEGGSR
jgi:hypothetical protein